MSITSNSKDSCKNFKKILNFSETEKHEQAYDVILVAGQSNSEGYGLGKTDTPWVLDDRIHILRNEFVAGIKLSLDGEFELFDKNKQYDAKIWSEIKPADNAYIELACERICREDHINKANLYLTFAKEYANKYLQDGRKVLLVETAVGGTGFTGANWNEGDVIFNRMIKMADLSLSLNPNNKMVAMIWHQGEHDAFENANFKSDPVKTGDYYEDKLRNLINIVRERYNENLPFICAGFTRFFTEQYIPYSLSIMERLEKITKTIKNARYIKTGDLKVNDEVVGDGDTIHFNRDALCILGKRYFDMYKDIIDENK